MKTLVVYFSRKGYVKKLAEERARECGGELLELRTTESTTGTLGFWWCGRYGMHRWPMPLEHYEADVAQYDKVIICSPVWVFSACAPIWAFIMQSMGKVKSVEYILVHFSGPMRYRKTCRLLDEALGVKHERLVSVQCVWGKCLRKREVTD